jgi:multiple sugar transport system ATP-binding protein
MAEITLTHVTKAFSPEVIAVKDLSLKIEDGEFLVLLGPSGCGKTTTLRMIAGLETQTSGDILIGDRLVNELRPGDRDIAFVFQFYALYPHLSVRDNIGFPLKAQNLPRAEIESRVEQVARRLRIEHLLRSSPNRLPGGEQQRVALGRAMVRQPQVFLMDEPLTNLDASLRADMRVELKALQSELGTTMVYVTHDQVEAMSMSHRIAVMDRGILQQIDTPLNVYRRPATLFVATFIGSPPMNIVHGVVDSGRVMADGGFVTELPARTRSEVRAGLPVVFGVRAENVSLDADAPLRGQILTREPLGDETIYVVDAAGQRITLKTSPRVRHAPGDTVGVSFDLTNSHLFDGATGLRLESEAAYV